VGLVVLASAATTGGRAPDAGAPAAQAPASARAAVSAPAPPTMSEPLLLDATTLASVSASGLASASSKHRAQSVQPGVRVQKTGRPKLVEDDPYQRKP
jgi:hypothetical protein